jgi:hypothetical protein
MANAPVKDIENQISALQKIADELNNSTATGTGEYIYAGQKYSRKQLDSFLSIVKKDISSLKKSIKPVLDLRDKLKSASATGPFQEMSPQQKKIVDTARMKLSNAEAGTYYLPELTGGVPSAAGVTPSGANVPAAPATTAPATPKKPTAPQGPFRPGTFGVPAVTTPTGPTGPKTGGGGTKVGATKVINGVSNTWDGKKWVPAKKVPPAVTAVVDWKPKFREMFPGQSWLLDLDSTKYSGLFKLLETGVKDQMWLTTESQQRFAAQLNNTDFYVELKTNDTVKNIKSLVGDLGFDKTPFNTFLKDAMNFGWKDDTLKQKVYEEAFRKDPATGNYVNTTTVERVRKSSPYLSIANIGKAFFSTVSDSTIAGVLTGSMIQDDVVRQQRELAKGKYGHLSSLIDQGLSLEDISDSYKTQASKVLEKDLNSIDMSQGAYSTAFDFGEEGKKRLMSTSDWEVKLRSDANFGWDKTQNAKEEARALASSISQAFGRVL